MMVKSAAGQVTHTAWAYLGLCSVKRLEVFLLFLTWEEKAKDLKGKNETKLEFPGVGEFKTKKSSVVHGMDTLQNQRNHC